MADSSLTGSESKRLQLNLTGALSPVIPPPSDRASLSSSASTVVIPLPHSTLNPSNGAISNLSAPPLTPSTPHEVFCQQFEKFYKTKGSQKAALLDLMFHGGVSLEDMGLPTSPFPNTVYSKIAPLFNMNPEYCGQDWKSVTVPRVSLPSSVRIALLENSIGAFAAYGPPQEQENETARSWFISTVSHMCIIGTLSILTITFSTLRVVVGQHNISLLWPFEPISDINATNK